MLDHNHSNNFIYKVIELSIKYGLDVNHQNGFDSTILHCYLARKQEIEISTPNSKIKVFVIPTNEELAIARDVVRLKSENNK